jgi:hypothetical protein
VLIHGFFNFLHLCRESARAEPHFCIAAGSAVAGACRTTTRIGAVGLALLGVTRAAAADNAPPARNGVDVLLAPITDIEVNAAGSAVDGGSAGASDAAEAEIDADIDTVRGIAGRANREPFANEDVDDKLVAALVVLAATAAAPLTGAVAAAAYAVLAIADTDSARPITVRGASAVISDAR